MNGEFFLRAGLTFVVTLLASVCWVLYFRFSHAKRAYAAAFADCGIILCGAVNVVSYTEDHRMLLPVLLGTFVGTVYAVKHRTES